MKITVLTENTAIDGYGAEHGLSLFIETENKKILFDMGQTELFADNAEKLGIDLSDVDFAVLSHGHYDHGGGLAKLFEINGKAPVYMSPYAFEPHYNGREKYIGLDVSLKENPQIVFVGNKTVVSPGITIYDCGENPEHEIDSAGLTVRVGNDFLPEDFRHEQYLMIEENGKRVLISGCSHRGIINIAERFAPDMLIGGFHFSKLPTDDVLKGYAEYLGGFETEYYTCHCTGTEQYEFMKKHMENLGYLSAGQSVTV